MLLDLNKLHGPREHVERTLPPSVFETADSDYRVVAPVRLTMDVEKAGDEAFGVKGRLSTQLELSCSRCLDPYEIPVDAAFESVSGVTTTGASVFTDFAQHGRGIFLWRAVLHWVGGLGVIALFVAILPRIGIAGRQLFFAEASTASAGEGIASQVRPRESGARCS